MLWKPINRIRRLDIQETSTTPKQSLMINFEAFKTKKFCGKLLNHIQQTQVESPLKNNHY